MPRRNENNYFSLTANSEYNSMMEGVEEDAINTLKKFLTMPKVNFLFISKCTYEIGDILIMLLLHIINRKLHANRKLCYLPFSCSIHTIHNFH